MGTYLDKFRSTLPSVQGKQILDLLQAKQSSGEIESIEQFRAKLTELTEALLATHLTPSLKVFLAKIGEVIDSSSYNEMLSRIEDDLVAAFSELETIDLVLQDHKQIINQVVLKTLQLAINELDARISLYEVINGDSLGLDKGQSNTFNTTQNNTTTRADKLSAILFANTTSDEDAVIDLNGERLTLGYIESREIPIFSVRQIFDSEVSASELDVQFEESKITNIIDGRNDTYWIYNTLLSSPKAGGIYHKIELDIPGTQDINFLQVEPASPYPMILTNIAIIKDNGNAIDLPVPETFINRVTKVGFPRIAADKIVLTFKQTNYIEAQFQQGPVDTTFAKALLAENAVVDVSSISDNLRELITSNITLEGVIGIDRIPVDKINRKYYQYLVGFDNIKVGFSRFQEQGIYVGKALTVNNLGQLALRTNESRPGELAGSTTVDTIEDDSKYYHSSIEYEVLAENFDGAGNFINIDRYPVLPSHITKVHHERLDLTTSINSSSKNAGLLRFYPISTGTSVYRNGTLLVEDLDWSQTDPSLSAINQTSYTAESRMAKGILIISPKSSDVYTVSYTPDLSNVLRLPKSSNSLSKVISLGPKGYIRQSKGNVITTDVVRGSDIIAKSNVYLIILLRRGAADEYSTPTVEDYTLLASSVDTNKFTDVLI